MTFPIPPIQTNTRQVTNSYIHLTFEKLSANPIGVKALPIQFSPCRYSGFMAGLSKKCGDAAFSAVGNSQHCNDLRLL
jgi:hypothetical protein